MKLRGRLFLAFLITTFVPVGALGIVVQNALLEARRSAHHETLQRRASSIRGRFERALAEDRRAVDALCEHELVIDRLLLQLATGRFGPAEEQALTTLVPPLMQARRFDALFLIDGRRSNTIDSNTNLGSSTSSGSSTGTGRVLAAGHDPDHAGASQRELLDVLPTQAGRAFVWPVRLLREGERAEEAMLLQGCVAERDGARVAVVVGHALARFVESVVGDPSPVVVGFAGAATLPRDGESEELLAFAAPRDAGPRRLVASIADAALERELAALKARALYVALGALLVALLAALALSWTLTKPIAELLEATRRVGRGDLESTISVGRRRDEVGRLMRAFNEMTHELAEARQRALRAERIAAWREVARRIAHEIKNPLQPIQMEIETIRKLHARGHANFDEEFLTSTAMILDEVRRLDRMVSEFSRFARLPRPKPRELDLREVLEHVAGLHPEGDVELVRYLDPAPRILADREQLTQVFLNLAQNAADAAEARHPGGGGRVELHLEPLSEEGEEGVRVSIVDNGPGIAPDDRLRVFEPYFTTKSKGTGLGLAIVHRIVGDHGGSVEIVDGIEGGAAFVVELPRSGPPPEVAATLTEEALPLDTRAPRE